MIAVAGFVCLILNPLVVALQRWGIRRRGWAVAIVAIWTVAVFIGLLAAFGYPLAHGVTHFSQRLPSYVQAAEHGRGWIGDLVTRFHLQAWVNRNAPRLQSLGTTLAKPALTAGKGAASLLATLATILALILLGQSATGYALGNLLTSLTAEQDAAGRVSGAARSETGIRDLARRAATGSGGAVRCAGPDRNRLALSWRSSARRITREFCLLRWRGSGSGSKRHGPFGLKKELLGGRRSSRRQIARNMRCRLTRLSARLRPVGERRATTASRHRHRRSRYAARREDHEQGRPAGGA
jgi:hypothetical protein